MNKDLNKLALPVLIAGLPKTGTTGLGSVVHAAVGGGMATEPTMFAQADAVPDCRVIKVVYPAHETRTLTDFMREFAACPRRIWIHRDPRDQLVSAFLYTWFRGHRMPEPKFRRALALTQAKEAGEKISFSSILEEVFGPDAYYHDPAYYIDRIIPYFRSDDSALLHRFAYEDLIHERYDTISAFLGLPLRSAEVNPEFRRVVRSRASGDWRRWLEPGDVDRLRALLTPYMTIMGYEDDWETVDEPPDPVNGSMYMRWLWSGAEGPRPVGEHESQSAR